jgi:hypothetical protein
MNNLRLSFAGVELSRLRTRVEKVGKEIGLVTGSAGSGEGRALVTAWTDLVQMLDLGSEPATRTCPHCQAQCSAGATLCGNCWASLPEPAPQSDLAKESANGGEAKQRAVASR